MRRLDKVTQVASKAERDAFIKFPWEIYRDDPVWVPPLLLERKEFLDRKKHPFFEHGDAALFLARSDEKIVGRIMASDDPNYNALSSNECWLLRTLRVHRTITRSQPHCSTPPRTGCAPRGATR